MSLKASLLERGWKYLVLCHQHLGRDVKKGVPLQSKFRMVAS